MPPFPRSMRGATCWRIWPAAASSSWCKEDVRDVADPHRRARSRMPSASTAPSAARPMPSSICIAVAGRLGVDLGIDDWDRLGRGRADHRRSDAVGPLPDGGFLLCGRLAGRHARAGRGGHAASRRADRRRQARSARSSRTRPTTMREVIRDLRQAADAGRRHRGPARQPGAQRRGDQALGGDAGLDAASRPRRSCSRPSSITTRAIDDPGARYR